MRIPDIQQRLRELGDALLQPLLLPIPGEAIGKELYHLANSLSRRKAVRKAPVTSVPMTPELAERIRECARLHPDWTYERIAQHHGVNTARVSEVLAGKRW
jgi:hypothetical protein